MVISASWLRDATLCLAWLAVWGLGHLAEFSTHASVWYPPAALTFAALAVIGPRAIPGLFAANLIAMFWSVWLYDIDAGWLNILGGGIANATVHIGSYGLGARALQRVADHQHHSLPRVLIAFLGIATATSMITTAGVLASLVGFGLLAPSAVADTWLAFWIGDFVALVVLGPLCGALLLKFVRAPAFWVEPLESVRADGLTGSFALKLLLGTGVTLAAMMLAAELDTVESAFLIFFLLIPQMWLTHSESPLRTAASLAIISLLVIVLIGALGLEEFVFVYQFAIAIIATTAWFGLSIPVLALDNAQLRERLMYDRLTGATSRDLLIFQAGQELARARRGAKSCLAVVDLDRFKSINDHFGHASGDQALKAVAEAMLSGTRASDVVARYGGDEFVIIFPDTSLDQACVRLEVLSERVRKSDAVSDRSLSISIGLTDSSPDDDFASWFNRADRALLRAKENGRDRIEIATIPDKR